jgi:hypothetical protein
MKASLLTATALVTALIASPVFSKILFDIDFADPLHSDGQSITIDSSINTPSIQTFGSTEMIAGYAGLEGNWAIFNQPDCFPLDQIILELPPGLKEVHFEADVYPRNLGSSDNVFSIMTDSSGYSARSTSFHGTVTRNSTTSKYTLMQFMTFSQSKSMDQSFTQVRWEVAI